MTSRNCRRGPEALESCPAGRVALAGACRGARRGHCWAAVARLALLSFQPGPASSPCPSRNCRRGPEMVIGGSFGGARQRVHGQEASTGRGEEAPRYTCSPETPLLFCIKRSSHPLLRTENQSYGSSCLQDDPLGAAVCDGPRLVCDRTAQRERPPSPAEDQSARHRQRQACSIHSSGVSRCACWIHPLRASRQCGLRPRLCLWTGQSDSSIGCLRRQRPMR